MSNFLCPNSKLAQQLLKVQGYGYIVDMDVENHIRTPDDYDPNHALPVIFSSHNVAEEFENINKEVKIVSWESDYPTKDLDH